jgi:hypothetical protein
LGAADDVSPEVRREGVGGAGVELGGGVGFLAFGGGFGAVGLGGDEFPGKGDEVFVCFG